MKHGYLLAAGLLAGFSSAQAQTTPGGVRIGSAGNPDPAAVLDIDASGKGLLIPRMDSVTRARIASPPDGLLVFQTNGRTGFWYATSGQWVFIPDKARSGDNLGNHVATQTLDLNNERLTAAATAALGDSIAQVEIRSTVPNKSVALITRSLYGRNYTRTMLSGYGRGPYGLDIDYAVWGNAYRAEGWAGIFTAGQPGQPLRWVGLAGHPGYVNANAAIRIVDGTQGAGKVLTSDGVGNGKWQTPAIPGMHTDAAGNVGIGTGNTLRGRLDVSGGDTYLVTDANNGNSQSVFMPGHLYLAPYNSATAVAFVQARVPNPTATTDIGLTLRTTNDGNLRDALRLNADGSANFYSSVTASVFSPSDQRLKTDLRPLSGALPGVLALRGVRYRYRTNLPDRALPAGEQLGLVAQEVERLYPELVTTDPDGYKAVNYAQLTPLLIEAVKELHAQLSTQTQRANQAQAAQQADHAALLTLQEQVAQLREAIAPGTRAQR